MKNQNIQKNKSKFERPHNGGNDQFTCQECRKVKITERIFSKELENQFELEKFSNYRDSNYGKKTIRVSLGNFTVTLNLLELWRYLNQRDSN